VDFHSVQQSFVTDLEVQSELDVIKPHSDPSRSLARQHAAKNWQSLASVVRPFFANPSTCHIAFGLSLALLVCIIAKTWLSVAHSTALKALMTALQERDLVAFYGGLFSVCKLLVLLVPVIGLHALLHEYFATEWRRALTRRLAMAYFARGTVYSLQLRSDIDSPDQRICQETQRVLHNFILLAEDTASSVANFVSFTYVLHQISPLACFCITSYAFLVTVVSTRGFGPRLAKYRQECTKQEASLRYFFIRAREHAESIAFFKGGLRELQRFDDLLGELAKTIYSQKKLIVAFRMLKDTSRWATFALAPLLVGPQYIKGDLEFGAIMQAHVAITAILESMVVMRRLEIFAALKVQAGRIHELEMASLADELAASKVELHENSGDGRMSPYVLEIQNLKLKTPATCQTPQHTLIEHLSIQLGHGTSLLVTGDSGIGKSALLRAIAGLWSDGAGSIQHPEQSALFFLPQRPYMCLGSLRDQVVYPQPAASFTDAEVCDVLKAVKLEHLWKRHGLAVEKNWSQILSAGEQQRLSFARTFLRKGLQLVLVDEGTSACDAENELHIYDMLRQHVPSYVTVGHKSELLQLHTHVLLLQKSLVQLQHGVHGCVRTVQEFQQVGDRCDDCSET
jgi:ABC-type uncharacterized transport system fused permease/ATPase subunit